MSVCACMHISDQVEIFPSWKQDMKSVFSSHSLQGNVHIWYIQDCTIKWWGRCSCCYVEHSSFYLFWIIDWLCKTKIYLGGLRPITNWIISSMKRPHVTVQLLDYRIKISSVKKAQNRWCCVTCSQNICRLATVTRIVPLYPALNIVQRTLEIPFCPIRYFHSKDMRLLLVPRVSKSRIEPEPSVTKLQFFFSFLFDKADSYSWLRLAPSYAAVGWGCRGISHDAPVSFLTLFPSICTYVL